MAGLLLAAGSGSRYGEPKALVDTGSGPWARRGVEALSGCDPVVVVVGASSAQVAELLPAGVLVVENPSFAQGMGSSLRAGLAALVAGPFATSEPTGEVPTGARNEGGAGPIDAALVLLVDLPDVGAEVVMRVLAAAGSAESAPGVLARAAFAGEPGHPVLLGRDHWPGVIETAVGDRGARNYLRDRRVSLVECADIGSGRDVDVPS